MQTGSELEVDARQDGLYARPGAGTDAKYAITKPEPSGYGPNFAGASLPPQVSQSRRKIFGLRPTTFVLSALLATVFILGVTSAALAGHYAMRNGATVAPISTPACPAANSPDGTGNSSNNSTDKNTLNWMPTSNCSSLGSQYTAPYTKALFSLHCQTNFVGNDLFGTLAITFEDCINNCALFNQHYNTHGLGNCTGVSYETNATAYPPSYKGNCFLKGASGDGSTSLLSDSATTVTS